MQILVSAVAQTVECPMAEIAAVFETVGVSVQTVAEMIVALHAAVDIPAVLALDIVPEQVADIDASPRLTSNHWPDQLHSQQY
jgi:L-alanine-DL-glutamate epimerase-like enolase superfamily enzyme